jgi:hypothetical protein
LQTRQRRVAAENDKKIQNLRKSKAERELIQAAEYEAWVDDEDFEGEIAQQQTRHLIRLAGKYLLPYPEKPDWAEERGPFYYRHLTREASARLRSAIRQEQKERSERWARWVPVLTVLTGLLGVLIGVIASLKK